MIPESDVEVTFGGDLVIRVEHHNGTVNIKFWVEELDGAGLSYGAELWDKDALWLADRIYKVLGRRVA